MQQRHARRARPKNKTLEVRCTGALTALTALPGGLAEDNIATPMAPVYRRSVVLPLTPRAVREAQMRENRLRQTPLDKLLDDPQADALERWVFAVELLEGNARCADYLGDRRRGGGSPSPLPDRFMRQARAHMTLRKALARESLAVLLLFAQQQRRVAGCRTAAELGCALASKGGNRALLWWRCVAQEGRKLVPLEDRIWKDLSQ